LLIRKLLSRKFDLFFVENGRSPDLFLVISPSRKKISGIEENNNSK